MTRKADKEYHWSAAAGCLLLFHGFSKKEALRTVAEYQAWWEARPGSKRARDIIYHEEPYDAACRLAGIDDVHFKKGWATYLQFIEEKDPFEAACRIADKRHAGLAKSVRRKASATAAKAAKVSAVESKQSSPRKKRKPA